MRVIAGTARGVPLRTPPGRDTRPTADRVREALFSSLAPALPGARVLDLFAGSGAVGIEALSRGAALAVLVEQQRGAAAVITRNLERTRLAGRARLRRLDAAAYCRNPRDGAFDVVFVDPPYGRDVRDVYALLADLRAHGALIPSTMVVVERDRRDPGLDAPLPDWLALDRDRSYGDTVLLYLRLEEANAV